MYLFLCFLIFTNILFEPNLSQRDLLLRNQWKCHIFGFLFLLEEGKNFRGKHQFMFFVWKVYVPVRDRTWSNYFSVGVGIGTKYMGHMGIEPRTFFQCSSTLRITPQRACNIQHLTEIYVLLCKFDFLNTTWKHFIIEFWVPMKQEKM